MMSLREAIARRPVLALLGVATVVTLAVMSAAPTASADTLGDGQWWRAAMGIDELNQRGAGQGVTVALIDGPIDSSVPELKGRVASSTTECLTASGETQKSDVSAPAAEHATMMASLLVGTGKGTAAGGRGVAGIAPKAALRHYAVGFTTPADPEKLTCRLKGEVSDKQDVATARAITQAVKDGARIISISLTTDYTTEYIPALLDAYRAGAIVVASTDNRGGKIYWPAIGNGVVTVTHVDRDGNLDNSASRHSGLVDFAAPGSKVAAGRWTPSGWRSDVISDGASQATAITAGGLADVWSAHPNATGNQVLQAARQAIGLRAERGKYLTWFRRVGQNLPKATGKTESYGFGIFSPADAVKLPVEKLALTSPMVSDDPIQDPTAAQIAAATQPASTPTASPNASSSQASNSPSTATSENATTHEPSTKGGAGALPWLLGAFVLVALAGTVALLRRRRSSPGAGPTPTTPTDPPLDSPTPATDGAAGTTKENTHA